MPTSLKEQTSSDETRFPGWPNSMKDVSYKEWFTGFRRVPMGLGLLSSDIAPIFDSRPHPEFVRQWRQTRKATVKETAIYFGLSDVQVLKVTGNNGK